MSTRSLIIVSNKDYSVYGQCFHDGDTVANMLNKYHNSQGSFKFIVHNLKNYGIKSVGKAIKFFNHSYNNEFQEKPLVFDSFYKMCYWLNNFDYPEYVILFKNSEWYSYRVKSRSDMENLFNGLKKMSKSEPVFSNENISNSVEQAEQLLSSLYGLLKQETITHFFNLIKHKDEHLTVETAKEILSFEQNEMVEDYLKSNLTSIKKNDLIDLIASKWDKFDITKIGNYVAHIIPLSRID